MDISFIIIMGSHLCFVIPKKYTMVFRILTLLLLPIICMAQVNSNGEKPTGELLSNEVSPIEMKRNASFNLEEIKVRWKKAALENCTGVPCVVTPPALSFTCGTSTVTDFDGNVYETVAIVGTGVAQCWTKTNLKVTKYNDGSLIPDLTTSTSNPWAPASGARTGYVAAGVTASYVGTFGYLYNWYAATDSRKLCPDGWHVPTDAEWTILIRIYNPTASASASGPQGLTAGTVLKSDVTNSSAGVGLGWDPASPVSPGTNTSGFSALPGGVRFPNGSFFYLESALISGVLLRTPPPPPGTAAWTITPATCIGSPAAAVSYLDIPFVVSGIDYLSI
jgi:uncharacterized protein (TIGR02145 family)